MKTNSDQKKFRLLWVDDRIAKLSTFIEALSSREFVVEVACGTQDAIEKATKQSFDVCLVDIQMPAPNGIECLRQLNKIQPLAKLASLSSYHYLEKYKTQLRSLDFPVQLLDKDFPDALAQNFDALFVDPIRELISKGVTATIQNQEKIFNEHSSRNPFDIPLAEFNRLPLTVKDQLRLQARKQVVDILNKAFSEGKIWAMFCGSADNYRTAASSMSEVMSDEDIMNFAISQQRPVFYFWRNFTSDDFWAPCNGSNAAPYPTVLLQFGEKQIRVHFDTGSPLTFFSYEELIELEAIKPTENFGPTWRAGFSKPYQAASLSIRVVLRCQSSDQAKFVDIRGLAVRDWEASPFMRKCEPSCKLEPEQELPRFCPDRKALIGRNLLIENALVLTLDGSKCATRLDYQKIEPTSTGMSDLSPKEKLY